MDENENIGIETEEETELEEGNIVELIDEEGKEIPFVFQGTVEYEGELYAFFSPTEDQEDISTDEVVIFRLGQDEDGEDLFLPVEDEALLEAVYNAFLESCEEGCGCDCEDCDHDCHEEGCDCHDGGCSCHTEKDE